MQITNIYLDIIYSMSNNTKYLKWYINIIINAQSRTNSRKSAIELLGYVEAHHIVPKCFFLKRKKVSKVAFIDLHPNNPDNIVYLSGREHFVCHMLLVKMLSNPRHKHFMTPPLSKMKCEKLHYYNSKSYETARILVSKYHHNKLEENRIKLKKPSTFKNKTYEEIYGQEKAKELKQLRSKTCKLKDNSSKNNPRFDNKIYKFLNIETKETYTSTRYEFYTKFNLRKSGVCGIINDGITYKKWKLA